MRELCQRDCQHRAAGAEVESVSRTLAAYNLFDHFEAAGCRAVMTGAEGKPSLDLDGEVAGAAPVAVVRAVHQKAPGADRLQALQRLRHPVDVGQDFAADRGIDPGFVQQDAQALLYGVHIVVSVKRDLPDAARLVGIDDRYRIAVFLEGRFERTEYPARRRRSPWKRKGASGSSRSGAAGGRWISLRPRAAAIW